MAEPIRYFDRYTGTIQTEQIYGERWLRWAYETPVGRLAVTTLFKRAIFSHWYGWRMNKRLSSSKVLPFIIDYGLDVEAFAKSPLEFATFNEFFYRALKKEARPIAPGDERAVFPADGRHLVVPDIDAAAGFYVKGAKFTAVDLLGDNALAAEFAGGAMVISRLCPVDYHRFHFPVAGTPTDAKTINGYLYSVSPVALRRNVHRLVENKRMLTVIESTRFGRVAMLEIGATCVGSIKQLYADGRPVEKGAEKGFFKFGGSCVIVLFQRGRIRFDDDLVAQSAGGIETYARMGDGLGIAMA